ncbi:TlpA family protein disulfide reductase [Salinispirillum sp. LH 10-3-1]|uniref:TlpA family protein disulfide reductase n=1 Tax=Salinispirillum sp. LH 10-3-1 TaxID=2952525 RepID=A0AB38YGI3_9GAMM
MPQLRAGLALGIALLVIGITGVWLSMIRLDRSPPANQEQTAVLDWISAQLSEELPRFQLPDHYGQMHNSTDWQDNVVLVNVWATWCEPCRQEVPLLVELQEGYGAQGFMVVGIALDDPAAVEKFAQEYDINYLSLIAAVDDPQVLDQLGSAALGLPHTLVFDRTGAQVDFHLGLLTAEVIHPVLHPLLTESTDFDPLAP